MLDEIKSNNNMSITKKHRWLGFVQGILFSKGFITISEERDVSKKKTLKCKINISP